MGKGISYKELCQHEDELYRDKDAISEEIKKLSNKSTKIVAELRRIRKAKFKILANKMNSMVVNLNLGEIKLIKEMYSDRSGFVSFKPKGERYRKEVCFKLNDGVTLDDIMNNDTSLVYTAHDNTIQYDFIEFFKLNVGEKCLTEV